MRWKIEKLKRSSRLEALSLRLLLFAVFFVTIFSTNNFVDAKKKFVPEKILYIPHDNRPIVFEQTVSVLEKAGYEIITPPEEFLGNYEKFG